jgi:hypothetical protein
MPINVHVGWFPIAGRQLNTIAFFEINAKTYSHKECLKRMRGTLRWTDAPNSALDLEVQTCACPIALRFPSAFRIPSTFRIGAVNIVVTKAMMTIIVKSVGVKAPTL